MENQFENKRKMEKISKKEIVILVAAIVVPGGLVALGIWKALEILKKGKL